MNEYYLKTKKYTCKDTKEVCIGYENYLQTDHWKRFRDSIIKQRKKCECCGAIEPIMNVHHISYINIGKEKASDVALLCIDCHKYIHRVKNGEAVCSDERILRLVKKNKPTKSKAKTTERTCDNCIFFTKSKEGGKFHPLCTKTMIYYPKHQIGYNCRKFNSKYETVTKKSKKSAKKKKNNKNKNNSNK